MFKVTCQIGAITDSFYLDGVKKKEASKVADVLANNLALNQDETRPEVLKIEPVDSAEGDVFTYFGMEVLSGSVEELVARRTALIEEGFLTCEVMNFGTGNVIVDLHKFKM